MKELVPVLACLAVIVVGASLPLTIAVRRLVVPYRKRYREDGTRIEDGREINVTVGPFKFSDQPAKGSTGG